VSTWGGGKKGGEGESAVFIVKKDNKIVRLIILKNKDTQMKSPRGDNHLSLN